MGNNCFKSVVEFIEYFLSGKKFRGDAFLGGEYYYFDPTIEKVVCELGIPYEISDVIAFEAYESHEPYTPIKLKKKYTMYCHWYIENKNQELRSYQSSSDNFESDEHVTHLETQIIKSFEV